MKSRPKPDYFSYHNPVPLAKYKLITLKNSPNLNAYLTFDPKKGFIW